MDERNRDDEGGEVVEREYERETETVTTEGEPREGNEAEERERLERERLEALDRGETPDSSGSSAGAGADD